MELQERYDAAMDRYFAQNPAPIASSRAVLETLGLTEEEDQYNRRRAAFEEAAAALGIDGFELAIRLMAESPEQAHEWRLEFHRRVAHNLGIEWDDYKRLNSLTE